MRKICGANGVPRLSFQCQFFLLIFFVLFCARRCLMGSKIIVGLMVLVYINMYLTLIFFLLLNESRRLAAVFFFYYYNDVYCSSSIHIVIIKLYCY